MDFGQLLSVARKNNETSKNSEGKYYSTKFSAPKKVSKEKTLSDNIKKFLLKKEQEEREKARLEKQKLAELMSRRDEKAKNKIRKMLKVTKSANKSVLADAIDTENTSVTIQGPDQPDEDDYGYVSNEAAAFFQKYVEKIGKTPDDKFAPSRPHSKSDIRGTKDRVKAAILREQDEKSAGSRSKSSSTITSTATKSHSSSSSSSSSRREIYDPEAEKNALERQKKDQQQKVRKNVPPPLDFKELLKIAEKKQFEPVFLNKPEEKKEPQRLLTKKEQIEKQNRKMYLEDRGKRKAGQQQAPSFGGKVPQPPIGKITKIPDKKVQTTNATGTVPKDPFKKPADPPAKTLGPDAKAKMNTVSNGIATQQNQKNKTISQKHSTKESPAPTATATLGSVKKTNQIAIKSNDSNKASAVRTNGNNNNVKKTSSQNGAQTKPTYNGPTREFPPRDLKKPIPQANSHTKTREFPPRDLQKRKQFPPPDIRRSKQPLKRRIYDDDDEDEYDSELDDFIEDDPEGEMHVSSYIQEIFGYDKNKYKDFDDDDSAMESNFAQQMREETISKKYGLMEDLEDMRKEAEEKKRKIKRKKMK